MGRGERRSCFNPRSHEGSDDISINRIYSNDMFQSTLPRRERLKSGDTLSGIAAFQSTLPRRERPVDAEIIQSAAVFQSTLPRRERRQNMSPGCLTLWFQSTLPRRERHFLLGFFGVSAPVSIHAPTKGATYVNKAEAEKTEVSIHAPTKGATWLQVFISESTLFQSTLPRRERRERRRENDSFRAVSIHAPTKGATCTAGTPRDPSAVSIHAPTKGATSPEQDSLCSLQFQSTLPRRERHY